MNLGLDLDEVYIEESLLQGLERSFTQLEMAFMPRLSEPMVFDLGISTLTLLPKLFDRLVDRCIVSRRGNPSADTFLSPEDMDLCQMGLLMIKDTSSVHYCMGSPTTTAATHDVSITHAGRVVLKLAGTMVIFESLIRQGLFSALEAVLRVVDREWLPELLAHEIPRVRDMAAGRLAQLEE